ncbi:MAG: hypothetical protein ACJ752_04575 [Gaiellaceae bacterium]
MTSLLRRTVALLPRTGSQTTYEVAATVEALPGATQQALAMLEDSPEGTAEWAFAVLPSGSRAVLEMFGAAEFDEAHRDRDLRPARITDLGRAVIHACAERHDLRQFIGAEPEEEQLRTQFETLLRKTSRRSSSSFSDSGTSSPA